MEDGIVHLTPGRKLSLLLRILLPYLKTHQTRLASLRFEAAFVRGRHRSEQHWEGSELPAGNRCPLQQPPNSRGVGSPNVIGAVLPQLDIKRN